MATKANETNADATKADESKDASQEKISAELQEALAAFKASAYHEIPAGYDLDWYHDPILIKHKDD